MTPYLKQWLLASALLPTALCAQVAVDRSKYPDYSDKVNPDPSLMQVKRSGTRAIMPTQSTFLPSSTKQAVRAALPRAFAICSHTS